MRGKEKGGRKGEVRNERDGRGKERLGEETKGGQ